MSWEPYYAALILLSTVVDYWCGNKMGNFDTKEGRKFYLRVSVFSNLFILGLFKYFNFFNESFASLFEALGMSYIIPALDFLLPVGISFYTFQTLSYSIDVYRGTLKPEPHFGKFALFVCFFPQLVAGPIEQAKNLLPQFHFNYKLKAENIVSGLRLILIGLFKKVVVANQLSSMVAYVFDSQEETHFVSLIFASLLFSQQIYCDFSAYSDIAQGSARLFGVKLMDNFQRPFYSKTLNEFWGRWHISLMNWFKDYLMFPLVRKRWKWQYVFLLIFIISGFWHGASWHYVLWGTFNGLFVIYGRVTKDYRTKIMNKTGLSKENFFRKSFQVLGVVTIFPSLTILFRCDSIKDVYLLVSSALNNWRVDFSALISNTNNYREELIYLGKDNIMFAITMLSLLFLETIQFTTRTIGFDSWFSRLPVFFRWTIYLLMTFSIILFSNISDAPYIYFQF
jgi:D-alanyl-lipoteichoic acid acyltransferase DltB (MBOAT superfamily)